MKYSNLIDKQRDKMISLAVRKIDPSRIMIEGDQDSLLFLSEYIKEHALGKSKTCEADVPLKINLVEHERGDNEFSRYLVMKKKTCNK